MRMSVDSYGAMNNLAGMCFDANAIIDNLCYSAFYHYYDNIAKIMHLHIAHVMPEWADLITDEMLELSARPVRKDINGYEKDYTDLKDILGVLMGTLVALRNATRSLTESADMSGDDEVRIFSEELLMKIQPYVKQAEEWINAVEKIGADSLNIHVGEYTHFIAH